MMIQKRTDREQIKELESKMGKSREVELRKHDGQAVVRAKREFEANDGGQN
jgi:hypothetical protein